jgi:hypothetical protein
MGEIEVTTFWVSPGGGALCGWVGAGTSGSSRPGQRQPVDTPLTCDNGQTVETVLAG